MGLAVGIMWIIYIVVAFILWAIFSSFIKRRFYKNLLIAFFILLPTWDVLIQKGLKTYFELFEMEPTIYSYPQRDKNNKIESLGLADVTDIEKRFLTYNGKTTKYMQPYYSDIPQNIDGYIEVLTYYYNLTEKSENIVRIYFEQKPYIFEYIKIQKARYQIKTTKIDDKLLGFYSKKDFLLVDTKTNKVLAKAVAFYFPNHRWYAWFRDDVLFNGDMLGWKTPPPILFVKETSNLDEMIKEALNIKMHTRNKYKGFKND